MPTSAVFNPTTHTNHRSYVSAVVETKLETLRARSTGELLRIDALWIHMWHFLFLSYMLSVSFLLYY
jgi:hypothetical protein